MSLWSPLTRLLLQPPGSLAYHLVLVFALVGALQGAYYHWQSTHYPQGIRLLRGLLALLALRTLLLLTQALVWPGVLTANWLPVLDRLVNLSGITLLLWLWAFPEPSPKADVATFLLLFFLAALAIFTWGMLPINALTWFHGSLLDRLWSALGLWIAVVGVGLLAWRRPEGNLFGILTLGILGLGHLVHLILIEPGSAASAVMRLAELTAYPFIFSLLYRYPLPTVVETQKPQVPSPSKETLPITTLQKPKKPPAEVALEALIQALRATTPAERAEKIAQAAAEYLIADLCLVVSPPYTSGEMEVVAGYDLIREQPLPGRTLDANRMPLVASAIEKAKTLRLPASSTSADLRTFAGWLGLSSGGPLLAVPIIADPELPALGALVFLSPFAQRPWTHKDAQQAEIFAHAAARIFLISLSGQGIRISELEEEVETLRQQLNEAQARLDESEAQRVELSQKLASAQEHLESLTLLMDDLKALQEEVNRLEDENQELKEQLLNLGYFPEEEKAPSTEEQAAQAQIQEEIDQLQQSLRLALEEVAFLKSELALRDQQMLALERHNTAPQQTLLYSSLISLSQDVRQHLSTIIGYADLLLSESAGLLGQLQREFLLRIRNAAEKMVKIVEDAVRLASFDMGSGTALEVEPVQLSDVLDASLTENSETLREKKLALRVAIPNSLPTLKVNRDALQQIMSNLIRNAILASPEEGDIFLKIEERALPEGRFIHLAVQDSGPGIAEEDIPRVFSRIYRTGYRTIEGLGDNGVGLPLVRALVEALGGRIWVESRSGEGATFEVLLPVEPPESTTDTDKGTTEEAEG